MQFFMPTLHPAAKFLRRPWINTSPSCTIFNRRSPTLYAAISLSRWKSVSNDPIEQNNDGSNLLVLPPLMPLLADWSNKLYLHIFRMLRPLRATFHKSAYPLVPSYLPYQLSSSSYKFRSAPNKPGVRRSEPPSLYLPVSFYDCSTGYSILPVRPPTVLLSQSFQVLTQRSVTKHLCPPMHKPATWNASS
jgi:hypothetical protein